MSILCVSLCGYNGIANIPAHLQQTPFNLAVVDKFEKDLTKFQALVRGHLARIRYKKMGNFYSFYQEFLTYIIHQFEMLPIVIMLQRKYTLLRGPTLMDCTHV